MYSLRENSKNRPLLLNKIFDPTQSTMGLTESVIFNSKCQINYRNMIGYHPPLKLILQIPPVALYSSQSC